MHSWIQYSNTSCPTIEVLLYYISHNKIIKRRTRKAQSCAGGVVQLLFGFVSFFVSFSFGLIRCLLIWRQGLPSLTKDSAHLSEGNIWVFGTDDISVLVSKEHVSGKCPLWGVWVLLSSGSSLLWFSWG